MDECVAGECSWGKRVEMDCWAGFEIEVGRGGSQGRQGVRLGWGQEEVEVDEEGSQLEKA